MLSFDKKHIAKVHFWQHAQKNFIANQKIASSKKKSCIGKSNILAVLLVNELTDLS